MSNVHVHHPTGGPSFMGPLLPSMAENWWVLLLRGVAALLFGLLALIWPGITLFALTLTVGIYLIVDGVLSLWEGLSGHASRVTPRWWLIVVGIIGILVGLGSVIWPAAMTVVLLLYFGIWGIIAGISTIIGAVALRRELEGEWLLILAGVLTTLFGIFLIMRPAAAALTVIWVIGVYAIIMAFIYFGLAFKLRSLRTA